MHVPQHNTNNIKNIKNLINIVYSYFFHLNKKKSKEFLDDYDILNLLEHMDQLIFFGD